MKLLLLILLISPVINTAVLNTVDNFARLNTPELFLDLICSYHGKPVYNTTSKEVKCECRNDYYTFNTEKPKVFNVTIQCEYEKKRKFFFVFLSLVQPLGFDLFYLEYYLLFSLNFIFGVITIIGNLWNYAVFSGRDYLKDKKNLIFFIMLIILTVIYLAKIAIAITSINDQNGVPMVDDLNYLISLK